MLRTSCAIPHNTYLLPLFLPLRPMDYLAYQLRLFYTEQLTPTQRHQVNEYLVTTLASPQHQALAQREITTTNNKDPYLLTHLISILQHAPTTEEVLQALLSFVSNTTGSFVKKAALATSYHGLHLLSKNPRHPFLQQVLSLLCHNENTPDAVHKVSAGVVLLTSCVETLSTKGNFPSDARDALLKQWQLRLNDILSALKIATTLPSPPFDTDVPISSVRALTSLVPLYPHVTDDVLCLLVRSIKGRFDETDAEILTAFIEILEFDVGDVSQVVEMVCGLLEAVAKGCEVGTDFAGRLMALSEVVFIKHETDYGLERMLNALLNVTRLWSGSTSDPGWLVGALGCCLTVLETITSHETHVELVHKFYGAMANFCVEICVRNSVLTTLIHEEEEMVEHGWDEAADVADVIAHPVALSDCLFIPVDDFQPDGFYSFCTREEYVNKCVETLLTIAKLSPDVAEETANFAVTILTDRTNLVDLITAAKIAFGVSAVYRSPDILWKVCELLNEGLWTEPQLGVHLLRTAADLVFLLADEPEETIRSIGGGLLAVSQQALAANTHFVITYAAAVLSLSLDASFRRLLFPKPPLPASVTLRTRYPAVEVMGVSSVIHWALFPTRDVDGAFEEWDDFEWRRRITAVRDTLQPVFVPSGGIPGMTRYTSLVNVVMDITHWASHPKTIAAVYSALSEDIVKVLNAAAGELCDNFFGVRNIDDRKEVGDALARVLMSLWKIKKVHDGRCVALEVVTGRVLPYAEESDMLNEVCLLVVTSMVNLEHIRGKAMRLARSTISRGDGLGCLAVGVLEDAAKYSFEGVLGIIEGCSAPDTTTCGRSLHVLLDLNLRKGLFENSEFVPFRERLARECLKIVGLVPGREDYREKALNVLWKLKECDYDVVESVIGEVGNVDAGWESRDEFGVAVTRLVEDQFVLNSSSVTRQ